MKKRVLSALLALAMVVSSTPARAFAVDGNAGNTAAGSPNTGDTTNPVLWVVVAAVCIGALVAPRKSVVAAYALLTGLYPIVKYGVEARLPRQVQTGVKLAYFNLVLAAAAVLVVCGLFFAVLAAPLIFLRTNSRVKINKWFFYAFYPAHLAAIALLQNIL